MPRLLTRGKKSNYCLGFLQPRPNCVSEIKKKILSTVSEQPPRWWTWLESQVLQLWRELTVQMIRRCWWLLPWTRSVLFWFAGSICLSDASQIWFQWWLRLEDRTDRERWWHVFFSGEGALRGWVLQA